MIARSKRAHRVAMLIQYGDKIGLFQFAVFKITLR
ncbi:Uncharacterised protein [Vibrio cholerae]|nr:Uncharacterised protein [Vibrio cholerae]